MGFFGKVFDRFKRAIGRNSMPIRNVLTKATNSFFDRRNQLKSTLPDEAKTFARMAEETYTLPDKRKPFIDGYEYVRSESNFNHAIYKNDEKKDIIFANKGTNYITDVFDDLDIISGSENDNVRFNEDLKRYDELVAKYPDYNIRLAGHSLSGAIMNYIGRNRPNASGYSFNAGAGFTSNRNTGNVKNYTTGRDLVSLLQTINNKDTNVVKQREGTDIHSIRNFT